MRAGEPGWEEECSIMAGLLPVRACVWMGCEGAGQGLGLTGGLLVSEAAGTSLGSRA